MKIASTVWEEVPFFIENKEMNLLSSKPQRLESYNLLDKNKPTNEYTMKSQSCTCEPPT
jgi:hypothetical protein